MTNFDEDILVYLDESMRLVMATPGFAGSAMDARLAILSLNLRALANNFMMVDSGDPPLVLDLKKVALGILGTVDFIEAAIPKGILEY